MRRPDRSFRWIILPLAAALLAISPLTSADDKVTLCHYPPGNPDRPLTISVGEAAVRAHLAHGDGFGECLSGFCGDGQVQGAEGCDLPDFGGRTCEDLLGPGATGTPACTDACELAAGTCQLCGNGMREQSEECDDGNLNPFDGCDSCVFVDTTPD